MLGRRWLPASWGGWWCQRAWTECLSDWSAEQEVILWKQKQTWWAPWTHFFFMCYWATALWLTAGTPPGVGDLSQFERSSCKLSVGLQTDATRQLINDTTGRTMLPQTRRCWTGERGGTTRRVSRSILSQTEVETLTGCWETVAPFTQPAWGGNVAPQNGGHCCSASEPAAEVVTVAN